jgi:predicted GNAT family N-acyltransferase
VSIPAAAVPGARDPVAGLRLAEWPEAEPLVMPLRLRVFVDEQGVPADIERDEFDPVSLHAIATDAAGAVIGTGRLLPDGHIGRMAVAAPLRGRGVGAQVLAVLLVAAARRGHARAILHSQVSAEGFYARYGFRRSGGVFMEAGIAHIVMERPLDPPA